MSNFTKPLLVTPLPDGQTWVIMRKFGYAIGSEKSKNVIRVPIGFQTDFASIPRAFWIVLPKWGKYGNASVIHDWLYWKQNYSKQESDLIFKEAMAVLNVRPITIFVIYWAVRLFGHSAWYRNQLDRKAGFNRVFAHKVSGIVWVGYKRPRFITRLVKYTWNKIKERN